LKLIGKTGPVKGTGFSAISFLKSIGYNYEEKTYWYPAKWEDGKLVFSIPAERFKGKSTKLGPGKGPF
jgi:hypothetical protein